MVYNYCHVTGSGKRRTDVCRRGIVDFFFLSCYQSQGEFHKEILLVTTRGVRLVTTLWTQVTN